MKYEVVHSLCCVTVRTLQLSSYHRRSGMRSALTLYYSTHRQSGDGHTLGVVSGAVSARMLAGPIKSMPTCIWLQASGGLRKVLELFDALSRRPSLVQPTAGG